MLEAWIWRPVWWEIPSSKQDGCSSFHEVPRAIAHWSPKECCSSPEAGSGKRLSLLIQVDMSHFPMDTCGHLGCSGLRYMYLHLIKCLPTNFCKNRFHPQRPSLFWTDYLLLSQEQITSDKHSWAWLQQILFHFISAFFAWNSQLTLYRNSEWLCFFQKKRNTKFPVKRVSSFENHAAPYSSDTSEQSNIIPSHSSQ